MRTSIQRSITEKLRDAIAVDAAKAAAAGSRLAGNQGTSLPGKTAMAVSPDILAPLAGQVRRKIIAVCGTNGKTTTNNILCTMLKAEGRKVVCNRLGSNMPAGIASAFINAAHPGGHLDADYACLEVDEASARLVFSHVKPDYLILTNLFRDQLDRYGEIDITMDLLKTAIRMVPEMKLIINADDPLSVSLAEETGNPFVCYGINTPAGHAIEETLRTGEVREGRFCRKCGALLQYDFYQYGQMGKYRCPVCGFKRPDPVYAASDVVLSEKLHFLAEGLPVETDLKGLYSVYNLLAVWSFLREEGCRLLFPDADNAVITGAGPRIRPDTTRFNEILSHYHAQFGRNETFCIDGRDVVLNLAKNPTGFNQNIEAMLEDSRPKRLVIVINDNSADGKDVSWLWDVDFDRIRDQSIRAVTVSGIRALDMCLRLKYDGIEADLADTPEAAIEKHLREGSEKLYVLVNYTALFSIHQYLQERTRK